MPPPTTAKPGSHRQARRGPAPSSDRHPRHRAGGQQGRHALATAIERGQQAAEQAGIDHRVEHGGHDDRLGLEDPSDPHDHLMELQAERVASLRGGQVVGLAGCMGRVASASAAAWKCWQGFSMAPAIPRSGGGCGWPDWAGSWPMARDIAGAADGTHFVWFGTSTDTKTGSEGIYVLARSMPTAARSPRCSWRRPPRTRRSSLSIPGCRCCMPVAESLRRGGQAQRAHPRVPSTTATGSLRGRSNEQPSGGSVPCHLGVDPRGQSRGGRQLRRWQHDLPGNRRRRAASHRSWRRHAGRVPSARSRSSKRCKRRSRSAPEALHAHFRRRLARRSSSRSSAISVSTR